MIKLFLKKVMAGRTTPVCIAIQHGNTNIGNSGNLHDMIVVTEINACRTAVATRPLEKGRVICQQELKPHALPATTFVLRAHPTSN